MPAILILLSLTACSDGTTSAMADYDTIIADMTTLVADHGAAVSSATTLEDVSAAEATYLTDWGTQRDAMSKHMDMLGGCTMDDADQGLMDDGMAMMDEMDAAVTDHTAAQDAAADVAACQTEETAHDTMMNEDITTMAAYSTEWADSMKCMASGMAM